MKNKILDTLFIAAFLIIGIVIFLTFKAYTKLEKYNDLVDHSYEVKNKLSETESEFRAMVVNQRTYIITQEKQYLDAYQRRNNLTKESLKNLHSLVIDNKTQLANVDLLIKKFFDREESLNQELLKLKEGKLLPGKNTNSYLNEGSNTTREFLNILNKIKYTENKLITSRKKNQIEGQKMAPITFSFLGLLSIGLIAFAYFTQKTDLEEKEEILFRKRILLKKLMSSKEEIEQYSKVTSHHLQEPVRKIQLYVDKAVVGLQENKQENIEEYLNKIKSLAGKTTDALKELASHSFLIENDTELGLFNFSDFLISEITLFNEENDVKILLNMDGVETPRLLLYPHLIKKLIHQLLEFPGNSISGVQNTIKLRIGSNVVTEGRLKWHKISFMFDEIYVEISTLNKIFDFLHELRLGGSQTSDYHGLSLCKKIMHSHHGFIIAENDQGNGTEFHLYFPFER